MQVCYAFVGVAASPTRTTISGDAMASAVAPSCPDVLLGGNCSLAWKTLNFGKYPPAVNFASSCFAVAGALLVIVSYVFFRDIRTGSRKVITFLAITNLIQACGSALSSLLYLVYVGPNDRDVEWCYVFDTSCQLLSFVTWWATLASFMWTCILALYLYSALVKGRIVLVNNSWIWFYVTTSIAPLVLLIPFLFFGVLGYSPFTYGGGCFVKTLVNDYQIEYSDWSTYPSLILKGIEFASYVIVGVLFGLMFVQFRMPGSSLVSGGGEGVYRGFSNAWCCVLSVVVCVMDRENLT